ncbi:iron complex transport system substrate-binding protein [Yokenella regensburgei]|uniref:Iron complex transport system substrate-binding protein n=1 Tax=Yokenella regensburgei TaxID=158877 RepID=A0ABX9S3H7_9ENTR|nr:ABC transporter substrate-binding protein [Yokenella regensburgei]RKR64463.1 iron complex transport system substrate-binding protein [Yokenella regensburgei]VFS17665.1 ABC-type Fe3+-citrate transport system, periplasmic component [Yokenella regensburgei]
MANTRALPAFIVSSLLIFPVISHASDFIQNKNTTNTAHDQKATTLKFNRIVITGNCPFGVIMANNLAYQHVIGVGPWAFLHSNMKLLRDMKPDIDRITTDFINKDYVVNMESLLNLQPDIIYYYGKSQDDNLERAGVPTVNLDAGGDTKFEPIETQLYWENTFNQTLGLPHSHKFADAWKTTLAEAKPYVEKMRGQHIRALYLEQSDGKQLKVSGPKTYGDTYLKMAGMENVASNLTVKGDAGRYINVSMEQIIQWDPDIIFVVFGSAKDILNNKNPGQDWSNVKAFKNKKIFSTPVGLHNWGGLSAETALLPLYMINKFNPDYISDQKMKELTRLHYKKMFNYAIPDALLDDELSQH